MIAELEKKNNCGGAKSIRGRGVFPIITLNQLYANKGVPFVIYLTHLFPMFPFDSPEKIRKSLVKWVKRVYYNKFSVAYID